ncbi:MAG: hypothetical protein BWY52_02642 [Chloroflexi bacterium ADurb.Bin325]|nr:MAG: hypothetical protein BWY52_02642 [Chloroflexi bacterium ADurb.Bin325]
MIDNSDMLVFWAVVLGRLLIPLLIPRWPLPTILAALVLDGVDQTIFQVFTDLPLDGYQGYDKALDVYYLTIAYIAAMRNWANLPAFRVSRFLNYYRLVGVAAFELSHLRVLLLIFPNTFEYFFIFYEAVRARWNPLRMGKRMVVIAAAAIWIVIKLPQEYWIHVAQLDATDFVKEHIFGAPLTASWAAALANRPWVLLLAAAGLLGLLFLARWLLASRLPAADWPLKLAADPLPEEIDERHEQLAYAAQTRILRPALLEKFVLVSLVSLIFASFLPTVRATSVQLYAAIALVIGVNALLSHWLALRGRGWESVAREFAVMALVNLGIVYLADLLLRRGGAALSLQLPLFFVLLLTLIVTLYDRYRVIYDVRRAQGGVV